MSGKLRYYSLIFIISLLSILIFNCGKLLSPFFDYEEEINYYPTVVHSLSAEELQQLQKEFDRLNNNRICSILNKFGLIGHACSYFYFRKNPKIKITDENIAINYAINTLVKNKKFTNATDSNELVKSGFYVKNVNDDSTLWVIRFGPQKYRGYEVFRAKIVVGLYGDGVYFIDSFWYKDIYIPPIDIISKETARKKVIGRKIIWNEGGGPIEFTVTENLVEVYIEKIIYPLEKEETIELRVAWRIPIIFGTSMIGWHIYIDTTTGEEIAIIQLFRH